ncbi:hypothetical protein [Mucilaginibacter sp. OK283]|uniref:tetratricopeptide repeat protein n=1 Tax=Mucilaginibacter sp. OK283 TaxID=1881049 RepID=UPI0008C29C25|nr:hypothetical protein [Mucilaginibacter sp. OK283]SEP40263.1 Tetratricopeptide repeat-containing protein [Mucilaginibacter sp. OK283]
MKIFFPLIAVTLVFSSCKRQPLVGKIYLDSLINHYTIPAAVADNNTDMKFWQRRIDPKNQQNTSEARYAATLIMRFHHFGDINDARSADSIYRSISNTYRHKLASADLALVAAAMLQHRFSSAQLLLDSAKMLGIKNYTSNNVSFDVSFELGHYNEAKFYLAQLKPFKDYNYYFRRAKYDHLLGMTDSALSAINKAVALAKGPYLKDIALSNQGDLYLHTGDLEKALSAYKECVRINSVDFHSILGIGWIALVHDHDPVAANRLFNFVLSHNKLPDPLFKMYQAAQQSGNKSMQKKYAAAFVHAATDPRYGMMYNKYLIEIYTGILHQPNEAEKLARAELLNRATPQTYAWLAYALFKNNKKNEAYRVYEQYVAGRPLEGLELFYIGSLLKGMGKGYDANKYLNAALQNKYDLSPEMAATLANDPEL